MSWSCHHRFALSALLLVAAQLPNAEAFAPPSTHWTRSRANTKYMVATSPEDLSVSTTRPENRLGWNGVLGGTGDDKGAIPIDLNGIVFSVSVLGEPKNFQ